MLAWGKHTSVSQTYLWAPCFLTSRAMFRRAVATAQTTRSLSILSNSTRMGSPFSFRTAARMYTDHCRHRKRTKGSRKMIISTSVRNRGAGMRFWCWRSMKCEFSSLHCCLFQFSEQRMKTTEESEVQNLTEYLNHSLHFQDFEWEFNSLHCIHLKMRVWSHQLSYTGCVYSKETVLNIKFTVLSKFVLDICLLFVELHDLDRQNWGVNVYLCQS